MLAVLDPLQFTTAVVETIRFIERNPVISL